MDDEIDEKGDHSNREMSKGSQSKSVLAEVAHLFTCLVAIFLVTSAIAWLVDSIALFYATIKEEKTRGRFVRPQFLFWLAVVLLALLSLIGVILFSLPPDRDHHEL